MTHKFFEEKIKPLLIYIGTFGAIFMSIAYIILMFVLVFGFNVQKDFRDSLIFAVVNAVVGFVIMMFLKIQGIDFAKGLPENVKVLEEYNSLRPKKVRTHSLTFFWVRSTIVDVIVKVLTVAFTTAGIIYIVVEGSNDYNMLLLSAVNLIMFLCFGFLNLVGAYDFFNENHIPYIKEKIETRKKELNTEPKTRNKRIKKKTTEAETEKDLAPEVEIIKIGE